MASRQLQKESWPWDRSPKPDKARWNAWLWALGMPGMAKKPSCRPFPGSMRFDQSATANHQRLIVARPSGVSTYLKVSWSAYPYALKFAPPGIEKTVYDLFVKNARLYPMHRTPRKRRRAPWR